MTNLYEGTNLDWAPTLKPGWDADVPDMERYQHAEQRKSKRIEALEA